MSVFPRFMWPLPSPIPRPHAHFTPKRLVAELAAPLNAGGTSIFLGIKSARILLVMPQVELKPILLTEKKCYHATLAQFWSGMTGIQ